MPKINFDNLSFLKIREMTKNIKGNMADDINSEREKE